jgi:hypothetical protein
VRKNKRSYAFVEVIGNLAIGFLAEVVRWAWRLGRDLVGPRSDWSFPKERAPRFAKG